jgi:hypothetical protein
MGLRPASLLHPSQATQDFQLLALHRRIHQSNRNFRLGLGQGQELIKLGLTDRPAAAMAYRLMHRITVNPGMLGPDGFVTGDLALNTTPGTFLERRREGILEELTDANLYGLRHEVTKLERWQKHLVVPIPQDIGSDAFGRYVGNLTREFAPTAIIIGNEENLHDVYTEDLQRMQWYVERFIAGHRAAKQLDPLVSVHMYGEAYRTWLDRRSFLQVVLSLLVGRNVLPDALLVHFYDHPDLLQPWLAEISVAVSNVTQHHLPIIVGELGHYGDVTGEGTILREGAEDEQRITTDEQSRTVAQLLTSATASIASQAFYFGAIDTIGAGGFESRKGLTEYVGNIGGILPRPALTAFRFMTDLLAGASAWSSTNRESGFTTVRFVRPPLTPDEEQDLEGWIVWVNNQRGESREFTLPTGFVGYDVYGRLLFDARREPFTIGQQESQNQHLGGDTYIFFRLTGNTPFPAA